MNPQDNKNNKKIIFTHIRHATAILEIENKKILIDPMLSEKESLGPIMLTGNKSRNPRVELPFSVKEIFDNSSHVLLTHLHFDHLDDKAKKSLPRQLPIICSKHDYNKINKLGFQKIAIIDKENNIDNLKITRFDADHGKGIIKQLMGKGSSYLIESENNKILITGDNILTEKLKNILVEKKPDILIVNGGAARFSFGKPITMKIEEIKEIASTLKKSKIIVLHLNALNHCTETREYCMEHVKNFSNILIPFEGEKIIL